MRRFLQVPPAIRNAHVRGELTFREARECDSTAAISPT